MQTSKERPGHTLHGLCTSINNFKQLSISLHVYVVVCHGLLDSPTYRTGSTESSAHPCLAARASLSRKLSVQNDRCVSPPRVVRSTAQQGGFATFIVRSPAFARSLLLLWKVKKWVSVRSSPHFPGFFRLGASTACLLANCLTAPLPLGSAKHM